MLKSGTTSTSITTTGSVEGGVAVGPCGKVGKIMMSTCWHGGWRELALSQAFLFAKVIP